MDILLTGAIPSLTELDVGWKWHPHGGRWAVSIRLVQIVHRHIQVGNEEFLRVGALRARGQLADAATWRR